MKPTTVQAIQSSFRTLLLAKPLERITVRDIVEDCGLTRNTFYYHYEDIYDLFADYLDGRVEQAFDALPANSALEDLISAALQNVIETPQLGRHMFSPGGREALRLYLNKLLSALIEREINRDAAASGLCPDDRRLLCDTCTHALYGSIEQWLTQPDAPPLRARLHRVSAAFSGAIHTAAVYCATHPTKEARL